MSGNTSVPDTAAPQDHPRPRLPATQAVSAYQQALALVNAGRSASTQSSPSASEADQLSDVTSDTGSAQPAERRIAPLGGRWAERAAARNRAQPHAARDDRTSTPIRLALPQQPSVSLPVGSNNVQGDASFSAAQSPDQPDSPDQPSDFDLLMQETDSTSDPAEQPTYSPDQQSQTDWDDSFPGVLTSNDQEAQPESELDQQIQVAPEDDVSMSDRDMQSSYDMQDIQDQQLQVSPEDDMSISDRDRSSSDMQDIHDQQLNALRKQISDLTAENQDLYQKLVDRDETIEQHAATFDTLNQEIKVTKTAAINAQYGTTSLQKQLKEKADQFDREKAQHDETKQDKALVEIQNEKLRKQMYRANDMLKDQINEREKVQKAHDELAADVTEKEGDIQDQAQEIENYMAQRQSDLVAIERLAAIHNILATYLPLENTLDITTATPAEISGLVQQLANAGRPGSPEYDADSPTELRVNRLAGRPSTTRHVSLSDQLGDERLSESEGEEEDERWEEEASAVAAVKTKPVGLGLADETLPESKKEVKNDTPEKPAASIADTASAGQIADEAAILAPSKPSNAAPTLPVSSSPELRGKLSRSVDKNPSTDLLWYAWFFLALITAFLLFINWQERRLWHGANEYTRDAVVQHRGLRSMIFGKGNGALWARHLRFEIERLIGVDTGVLG